MTNGPTPPSDFSPSTPPPPPSPPRSPSPLTPSPWSSGGEPTGPPSIAPPVPPVGPPVAGSSASGAPGVEFPDPATVVPVPPSSGSGTRKWILVGAGVVAVLGVCVVAVRSLSGGSDGADSPQAAVEAMVASLTNEDPVAMVNVMAPTEMRTAGSLMQRSVDALTGDGETANRLRDFGIDLTVEDLLPGLELDVVESEYDVENLSDDVAKVTVQKLEVDWDFDINEFLDHVDVDAIAGGVVDEQELVDEFVNNVGGSFDLADLGADEDQLFLMAVKEDGEWYISPTYSILEQVRIANDMPEADFSEPKGEGADSLEAGIEQMGMALVDGDVDGIIGALPPSRYQAFYAYREMLVELAGPDMAGTEVDISVGEVREFDDNQGIGVELIDLSVEVEDSGLEIDGNCATLIEYGERTEYCLDDLGDAAAPFEDGIPGIDKFWLVMVKEDGKYYVDPIGTIISVIDAIDEDEMSDKLEEIAD
jgi:hypothetical protein